MAEELYYQDAYLRDFTAVVQEQSENGVRLDRTAFYPGGGGQPNDIGELLAGGQDWKVTRVKRVEG